MRRRDISMGLLAAASGTAIPGQSVATPGSRSFDRTEKEVAAKVTPANPDIPSHEVAGQVYPQRYGARFDGKTDDTDALNAAFAVAARARAVTVMPGGVALVRELQFGSNSSSGMSAAPPGLQGQGSQTVLKALNGSTGTVLSARGLTGVFLRDFTVDGGGFRPICIDTSWPHTVGPSCQNTYENVWVQNFTESGWLAINDNQSSFRDIVARGAAKQGLSGVRIEASGGGIFLDNVSVPDSFLSLCCQNAAITSGFSVGIRLNESQSGVNFLSFSGGTQIYCNPTTSSHFEDANSTTPGRYITSLVANGLYLISAAGDAPTNTINCGVVGKVSLQNCAFISQPGARGPWHLYGPRAYNSNQPHPAFVELDGTLQAEVVINTPRGFITQCRDVGVANVGTVSDYPSRVTYRNSIGLPAGLAANTYSTVVPATSMTETGATYLVSIAATLPNREPLIFTGLVCSAGSDGESAPSAPIPPAAAAPSDSISLRHCAAEKVEETWHTGLEVAFKESLPRNSKLSVLLLRLGNPLLHY